MTSAPRRRVVVRSAGLFLALAMLAVSTASAEDWNQWLGPNRNGTTPDTSGTWPPTRKWNKNVGLGCTSPIIVGSTVVAMGWSSSQDTVYCFDAESGSVVWSQSYPCGQWARRAIGGKTHWGGGPLSTPAYDSSTGYLYTLSANGDLNCWNANSSGQKVWNKNVWDLYGRPNRPGTYDCGMCTSPLVYGSWVIVELGGSGGTVLALNKSNGSKAWSSQCTDVEGHSSGPSAVFTVQGVPCLATLTEDGLVAMRLDAGNYGKTIGGGRYAWWTDFSCNIPTPVPMGDSVFVTTSYNQNKCALVKFTLTGKTEQFKTAAVGSKVASPAVWNGKIYAIDENPVECLDPSSPGSTVWSEGGFGHGSLLVTGDGKVVAFGSGDVVLISATAGSYQELHRMDNVSSINGNSDSCYPHLAFGNGYLVVKDKQGNVVAFSVGATAPEPPAAPTGVSATDGTYPDKVWVTWTASSGATSYEVWRHTTNNSGSATKIGDPAGTGYDDTSAVAGTTYYYWVKAKNSAGTSGFSAPDTGRRAAPSAPQVTTKPASSVAATSARLNGEVTSTGGENPTVKIYWGTTDGGTTAGNWAKVENLGVKGAGTFYRDVTGLTEGQKYYFRCYAENSVGGAWASASQSFTPTAPVGGLVGHWEFDDGSGTTAADSSANGNDGTVNGATWTTGIVGPGALSFGGSDSDYVEIPNESDYDLADAVSYAVWIKMDSGSQSWAGVVTKGDHMNIQRYNLENYVVWQTKDYPGTISQYQLEETANVVDGQWHHVAVTFDGAQKCIYVDGAESNSAAATGTINTTDYPIIMGKNGSAAGHAFKGLIDDVRIYDYALSAGEVKTLYDMGSGGPGDPTITTHPQDQVVTEGDPASFTVVATGTGTLSYQWYEDGAAITGATSATYTISSTTLAQSGHKFHCVVTDSGGTATSNQATLTVNPPAGQGPTITQQPQDVTVTAGETATFAVQAQTSGGTLSYQWKKDGANVAGATGASYTTPATVLGDSGAKFTCVVTDQNGSATSNQATLTVNPPAGQGPTITQQPQDVTVTEGETATFAVQAQASAGTLSYQWKKNGANIAGATSASHTTPAAVLADDGAQFTCVVTDQNGSTTSRAATLTVNAPIVDTDGDNLPDSWETLYGLNPNSSDTNGDGTLDPNEDPDGDGYTNLEEYQNGTNPNVSDAEVEDTTSAFGCGAGASGAAGGAALALFLAAFCGLALRASRADTRQASWERGAVGWIGRPFC